MHPVGWVFKAAIIGVRPVRSRSKPAPVVFVIKPALPHPPSAVAPARKQNLRPILRGSAYVFPLAHFPSSPAAARMADTSDLRTFSLTFLPIGSGQ